MSTWISKALGLCLILSLAACQINTETFAIGGGARQISVLGDEMLVVAPTGYCVDKTSLRQQSDGAVVLIGRCNSTSRLPPAVISVTIGSVASAGVVADGGLAMAAFFQTPGGRAMLSRTGQAETVRLRQSGSVNGVFFMHIDEANVGAYWRAILGISGRLVTVSVQGPEGIELDPKAGQNLLTATIASMRRGNLL